MRISGGDAKGVRLKVPPGARPASERVRQAVFSSIAAFVPDARVLDLYCGSGAYGLEALSRGADRAIFVDNDRQAVATCRANAKASGFETYAQVYQLEIEHYLRRRASRDGPFDLVFLDPPYARASIAPLGDVVDHLTPHGHVVLERRKSGEDVSVPDSVVVEADRRYGDTRVLVFRRQGAS